MKRSKIFLIVGSLISLLLIATPTSSTAAGCSDPNKDGRTVGKIIVGGTTVDVKNVNYPAGGQLNPPRSPLNAGVSVRHAPLKADVGSSIIVWHINYSGCNGKLNVINSKKRGFTFSVVDETGETRTYAIAEVLRIPKGRYRPEWFRLDGPRQLVLVTCVGVVVNGHYKDNLVIIARPTA